MCADVIGGSAAVRLPWGVLRERVAFPESVHINVNNKPGPFVLQMIFAEFTVLAEKKIEQVLDSQVQYCHAVTRLMTGFQMKLGWPASCLLDSLIQVV